MAIGKPPSAQQQDARRQAPKASRLGRFGQAPTLNTDPGLLSSASQFTENRIRANKEELTRAKSLAKATTFNQLDAMTNEVLQPLLIAEGANVQKEWHSAQEKFAENFDKIRERYAEEDFEKDLMPLYEKASAGFQATGQTHVARELHKVAKREHTQQVARQQDSSIRNIIKEDMAGADAFINGIDGSTGDDFTALTGYADLLGMTSKADEDINIDGEPDQRTALVEKYVSDTLVESITGLASEDKAAKARDIFDKYKDRIDPSAWPQIERMLDAAGDAEKESNALGLAVQLYNEKDSKKRHQMMIGLAKGDHKLFSLMNKLVRTMDQNKERADNKAIQQFDTALVLKIEEAHDKGVSYADVKEIVEPTLRQGLGIEKLTRQHANGLRSYMDALWKGEPPVTDAQYYRQLIAEFRTNREKFATRNLFSPEATKKLSKQARSFFTSLQKNELGDLTRGFDSADRRSITNLLLDSDLDETEIIEAYDDLAQMKRKGEDRDPKARALYLQNLMEKVRLKKASQVGWGRWIGEGIGILSDMSPKRDLYAATSKDINLFSSPIEALNTATKLDSKYPSRQTAEQTYAITTREIGPLTEKNYSSFMRRWTELYTTLRRNQLQEEE